MGIRPRNVRLPFLHTYRDRHGKVRSSYRRVEKRGGPRITVPISGEFGSVAWHDSYSKIHAEFEGEKRRAPQSPDTIREIIPRWLASLSDKTASTKAHYISIAKKLDDWVGDRKVNSFRLKEVFDLQEMIAEQKSPGVAERCTMVMRLIFQYACERGLMDSNPAKGMKKPVGYKKEPYRAWTDAEIETVLTKAPDHIVRCVMVLLCTGLRVSDAVRLQWHHVQGNYIEVDQTLKTSVPVSIPIGADLAAELSKPKRGMFLLLSHTGRAYSPGRCSTDIRTHMRRVGIEDTPPIHGLRKNAVMKLLEDGNDYEIIHAITGQSHDMIRHYGKAYERRRAASRAVIKSRFGKHEG